GDGAGGGTEPPGVAGPKAAATGPLDAATMGATMDTGAGAERGNRGPPPVGSAESGKGSVRGRGGSMASGISPWTWLRRRRTLSLSDPARDGRRLESSDTGNLESTTFDRYLTSLRTAGKIISLTRNRLSFQAGQILFCGFGRDHAETATRFPSASSFAARIAR